MCGLTEIKCRPDEYGYITPVMSEGEFAEKFEKLDGAITRIRMEE